MSETKSESIDQRMQLKDFKTLTLYQKAISLEDEIDEIVKGFPSEEKYRLVDQLIRCVTSIGANIAESNGGQYGGREKYHLGVAFGSANEVSGLFGRVILPRRLSSVWMKKPRNFAESWSGCSSG